MKIRVPKLTTKMFIRKIMGKKKCHGLPPGILKSMQVCDNLNRE